MSETAQSWRTRDIPVLIGIVAGLFSSATFAQNAQNWTITPRVSGQELYTDNVLLVPTNRQSDLVTTLAPGITISGETSRLRANLDYAPTVQLYAFTPDLNFVGQNLYANGTGTIIPDLFFVDARGLLSVQPTLPGLGTSLTTISTASLLGPSFVNASQGIPRSQLSQISTFSASPYLVRRFDGVGTAELRYSFTESDTSATQSTSPLIPVSPTPLGTALQPSSQTTNEATAVFLTGDNLGRRLQSRLFLDAAQSSGTGVNQGNQLIGTIESAYSVTPRLAALTTIGHEQLSFGGFPPTHIDGVVYGIGARFTPDPDSTIVLSYGRRNGITAPYATILYDITPRTTLSASYTAGLSTVNQEIANSLALSDVNQSGQAVDLRTLLPLVISNPTLGLQNGLFRNKQLTVSLKTDLERDHITLSFNRSEMNLVSQSIPGSGVSESSSQVNLGWTREINPRTTGNLGIGYATIAFAAPANAQEEIFTANVSMNYQFTPSLTGTATYNFLNRTSPQPLFQLKSNIVMVGLRKEF